MIGWVWTALTLAAAVAIALCRWWDGLRARAAWRHAEDDALAWDNHAADSEIRNLEACWQLPAHQPDHR